MLTIFKFYLYRYHYKKATKTQLTVVSVVKNHQNPSIIFERVIFFGVYSLVLVALLYARDIS